MIADKYQVIVVGCGASGMAAADYLQSKGIRCKVLEGQARVGGRVNTNFDFGFPIDLGASFIHGHKDNHIYALAKKHKIPMVEFDYEDAVAFFDGEEKDFDKIQEKFENFEELIEEASNNAAENMSLRDLTNKVADDEELEGEDRLIFELYLKTEIESEYASTLERLSAGEFAESEGMEGEDFVMPGGYFGIFEKVAENLDVALSTPVAQIDQSNGQEVIVRCTNGTSWRADYLICTLPLGILQSHAVQFIPPLAHKKTETIKKLGFGTLDKLVLVFEDPFWPDNHAFYLADSSHNDFAFVANLQKIWKAPALLVFIPESTKLKYGTEPGILNFALRMLAQAFPDADLSNYKYKLTNWGLDAFTRGSYSSFAKGSEMEDLKAFSKPEGRVFFAGEHTYQPDMCTVNGAWSSGLEAARAVLNELD